MRIKSLSMVSVLVFKLYCSKLYEVFNIHFNKVQYIIDIKKLGN